MSSSFQRFFTFRFIFFVFLHFIDSLSLLVHFTLSSSLETPVQFSRTFQVGGERVPFSTLFLWICFYKCSNNTQFQLYSCFMIALSLLSQHLVQLDRVLFLYVWVWQLPTENIAVRKQENFLKGTSLLLCHLLWRQ